MEFRTRKMVMLKDLNPAGTLFGGRALEWIDEEAAIFSLCQCPHANHLVTKIMSDINFMSPAHLGDIIEIGMDVVKFGNTSITVKCSMRNKTTKTEILKVDTIVFVNLDENGKPIRYDVPLTQAKILRGDTQPPAFTTADDKEKELRKTYTC